MGVAGAAVGEPTQGTKPLTWYRAVRSSMAHEPDTRPADPALRPRDLALLLLASGDLRPRKRARDQQADRVGLELKRRILERLAAIDPEPADLEAALLGVVEEIGSPTGPARAVATVI